MTKVEPRCQPLADSPSHQWAPTCHHADCIALHYQIRRKLRTPAQRHAHIVTLTSGRASCAPQGQECQLHITRRADYKVEGATGDGDNPQIKFLCIAGRIRYAPTGGWAEPPQRYSTAMLGYISCVHTGKPEPALGEEN